MFFNWTKNDVLKSPMLMLYDVKPNEPKNNIIIIKWLINMDRG